MTTIFETGAPQTIAQVLANKDARAALQAQLVATKAPATIVVTKLNIPGPIKANQTLSRVFTAGMAAWQNRLATAHVSQTIAADWDQPTGREQFEVVAESAAVVKRLAVQFEDQFTLGRLFDLDVLTVQDGQVKPLSRSDFDLPVRTCFICGRPAKECARSRRHSVAELQTMISQRVQEFFAKEGPTDA